MRIVSLLPSATDILVSLGAKGDVVGVSHSCGPEWSHVPRLTRTWIDTQSPSAEIDAQVKNATRPLYELDIEQLQSLKPDVVVSQSLCEVCAIPAGDVDVAIQALPNRPGLIDLSPSRLNDVPADFSLVGEKIGRQKEAQTLREAWQASFDPYYQKHKTRNLNVAFLDWLDPPYAAGHWVPDMIEWLGATSALAQPGEPSHEITWRDVSEAKPDLVVAACCGFDQTRAAQDGHKLPCNVSYLDGYQQFSRPSPVLMESIATLDALLTAFTRA